VALKRINHIWAAIQTSGPGSIESFKHDTLVLKVCCEKSFSGQNP
jgi:hypothetical protein